MFTLVEAASGLSEPGMMLRLDHVTFADNGWVLSFLFLDLRIVGHWFNDSNGARFLTRSFDSFNDLTRKSFFDALTRNWNLILIICLGSQELSNGGIHRTFSHGLYFCKGRKVIQRSTFCT